MLTLLEKENRIKAVIGKKIRVFSITPTNGITRLDATLKNYRKLEVAGMILAIFEIEENSEAVVNADLVEVYNEEKKEWEELYAKPE